MNVVQFEDDRVCQMMVKKRLQKEFDDVNIKQFDSIVTAAIDLMITKPDYVICDYTFKHGLNACYVFDVLAESGAEIIFLSSSEPLKIRLEVLRCRAEVPENFHFYRKGDFKFLEVLEAAYA